MQTELTVKKISQKIYFVRNCRVMLDADLAMLYEVETRNLNKAVRRNLDRFPEDFMFQISPEEFEILMFQIGTSRSEVKSTNSTWGGRRKLPLVFSEQGVAMLSSILRSKRAALVNIEIIRTFVQLREFLLSNKELAQKLATLERKYDTQFKVVFDAIREMMNPVVSPKRKIGIKPD